MSQSTCERCGSRLPADAKFCPNCGFAIGSPVAEERKVVTVLFADVARSTELAAKLDPERFRELMAAFFREVTEELESLRGRAENFAGDAVLGVFGLPSAHDDDALRAVRAALGLRDRLARLAQDVQLPEPLQLRVGINTGSVAVAAGPIDQHHLAGTTVNLAARLQQGAEPGEVLVGETSWQLTREAVEYGPVRKIAAKGFDEEVVARPVVAVSTRSSRRTIPLVDRRRELALLAEAFERVRETSRAHLVTLLGEPGVGKSRLVQEFLASLPESTKVLRGHANAFQEEVTFAPLAGMIRRELGVDRRAPAEEVKGRLEEVVAGCCEESEIEQVTARLGLALGMGAEARDDQKYWVAEVRAGLITFLTGLARERPVVLVFEDLHFAQSPLLELIERVARETRRAPVLLLCVARWDLLEGRPAWAGGLRDAISLDLEPLSLTDAAELALEAGERLDRDAAERIARHAGGNPFFIVETTGMLLHEGAAPPPGALSGPSGRLLPPTVQAVVAARIDRLPPEARLLVRTASVFPRARFHEWELALIAEPRADVLEVLQDEELLVHEDDRPGIWRFRHGLLRDVAYESLAKRERRRLHLLLAERLAEREGERYPRSVAYHLEQAAKASLDLDPTDRALADRAMDALKDAADLARKGIESRAAIHLYERALALAGPERAWGKREAWIHSGIGEARYWLGEFDAAEPPLSKALQLADGDAWIRAHACRFLADISLSLHGDQERAEQLFNQALAAARDLDEPFTVARTLLAAGWAPYWRNELAGSRAMFEEALAVARGNPEGDAWAEARALVSLGVVISPVGDEEESERLSREAVAIGEKRGDPFTMAVARQSLANSLRRMLRLDEAMPLVGQAIDGFRELGARWELADALISRGVIERLAGRLEEAEADLREALRLCGELNERRSLLAWACSELVSVLVTGGNAAAARQVLSETEELAGGEGVSALDDLRQAEMLVLLAEGDREKAREVDALSLETERRRGWPNQFAAQVWWTATLFGAEAAGGEGEVDRARDALEAAHWYRALRDPELVRS